MLRVTTMKFIRYYFMQPIVVILFLSGTVNACNNQGMHDGQLPLRRVSVSVALDARESLFDALKTYAQEQEFAIRIVPISSSEKGKIGIDMWRTDIKVFGDNLGSPNIFNIDYYSNDRDHPPTDASLDFQLEQLKAAIALVPEATFTLRE